MHRAPAAEDVFRAIADPTRRALLDALAEGERTAGELGEPFGISQPALSQHLRVLREAGLVRQRKDGRHRVYRLDPKQLESVHRWVAFYERFWKRRLKALGKHLEKQQ
jgi:DNA-binding transcriptional ArsR family regulator